MHSITVALPYPEGTNKNSYNFVISHLFTHGDKAGTTETIRPAKLDNGLQFKVYNLSPIGVGFKRISNNSFSSTTYTITATAGAGGSISTDKFVSVDEGNSAGFTMTPDKGYVISDVLVDGKSVGAVGSYLFTNVTADHTIEVLFKVSGSHLNPQTSVDLGDAAVYDRLEDARE